MIPSLIWFTNNNKDSSHFLSFSLPYLITLQFLFFLLSNQIYPIFYFFLNIFFLCFLLYFILMFFLFFYYFLKIICIAIYTMKRLPKYPKLAKIITRLFSFIVLNFNFSMKMYITICINTPAVKATTRQIMPRTISIEARQN